jgi:hypothetical protein
VLQRPNVKEAPGLNCYGREKFVLQAALANVSPASAMSTDVYPAPPGIRWVRYQNSKELEYVPKIRQLISKDLSEPYSIYVYRYFLYQWGDLCFMVSCT